MIRSAFFRDARGGPAIEFAITAPIYFFGLFGLLQVGVWLFADFSLQRAVDDAARCGALQLSKCSSLTSYAASATVGLPVTASAFTSGTCTLSGANGKKVSATYTVPTFVPALPNISVNVSACYPT